MHKKVMRVILFIHITAVLLSACGRSNEEPEVVELYIPDTRENLTMPEAPTILETEETLETWRTSPEYVKRLEEISGWQQEMEELRLASEGEPLDVPWYSSYRAYVADWTLIEDSEEWSSYFDYLKFYFGEYYQFDSYWLCDIDKNGTPELFLYSATGYMEDMVTVVTYTDQPVVTEVEMIHGINLETGELIVHGHWHGAGGSWIGEWMGFKIQEDTSKRSFYIDFYDYGSENMEQNHYVIYNTETDEYEYQVDSKEYDEIYAAHVSNCVPVSDIPKYNFTDLSGLKVIYK